MARPAETYRAVRRKLEPFKRLAGDNRRQPFDEKLIKSRPHLARGWDYSKGNRLKFNSVRDYYLGAKKQYRHLMRGGL